MIIFASILIFAGVGYFFSRANPQVERKNIFPIFLTAYSIRITLAFILYNIALNKGRMGFFLGLDDCYSGSLSLEISRHWMKFGPSFPEHIRLNFADPVALLVHTRANYELFTAFILFIFNNNPAVLLFANCLFGALGVIMLYKVSRLFFDEKVSLISAWIFALWPSLLFWSTLNLREAPVTFLLLAVTFFAVKILQKKIFSRNAIWDYIGFFILAMFLYAFLKPLPYLILFLMSIMALAEAVRRFAANRSFIVKCLAVMLLICIVAAPVIFEKTRLGERVKQIFVYEIGTLGSVLSDPVGAIEHSRQARMNRGSDILPDLHIKSYRDLIMFLPISLVIGICYPLPWPLHSLKALASVPEMFLWYFLFPFFIRGIFLSLKVLKEKRGALLLIALFIFSFLIILPMHDSNAGALFRHRGVILPLAFMFISFGLPIKAISARLFRNSKPQG